MRVARSPEYPADYAAGCAALASALCHQGAACTPDAGNGECCIVHPNGSLCPQPEWYCEVEVNNDVCGDATLDPSAASACAQAIPQATCASGQRGVQLASACPFAD